MLQCLCALGKEVRPKGFELAICGNFLVGGIGGLEEAKKALVDINAMEINEYDQVNLKGEGRFLFRRTFHCGRHCVHGCNL